MIGLFCIDPGKSTGVAWGIVDERAKLALDAVRDRINDGSDTFTGTPMEQARRLWRCWTAFKDECVLKGLMDPDHVQIVCEDFILTPGQHPGGKDGTAPERIAWAFEGYRNGRFDTYRREKHYSEMHWQTPSAASRYKDRKILEKANAWIRGREHERSAFSHMILRVNKVMDQSR